jgi:hypothetical protein
MVIFTKPLPSKPQAVASPSAYKARAVGITAHGILNPGEFVKDKLYEHQNPAIAKTIAKLQKQTNYFCKKYEL